MNTRTRHLINIAATTVLATILLCVGLFWARWLNAMMRVDLLPGSAQEVTIHPAQHVRTEEGADPNRLAPPVVTARTVPGFPLNTGLGALRYVQRRVPGMSSGPRAVEYLFRWSLESDKLYFDPSLGLIVRKGIERIRREDGTRVNRPFTSYAGPEGVSQAPEERLGRFTSLLADAFQIEPQVVYDRGARRFFVIRWRENDLGVSKGPELPDDGSCRPVQIGVLTKNFVAIEGPRSARESMPWTIDYVGLVQVLDASGRIDWLDLDTLEIGGTAGYLPMPETIFGSRRSIARPQDVAGYHVAPLRRTDGQARGTAVATLSREGLALQLDYFDANGLRIAGGQSRIPRYAQAGDAGGHIERVPSEKAVYDHPGVWVTKLLLENLHPPILVLLSYFRGTEFEATAGYRSLFLLPDSFVAMVARSGRDVTWWERFFWAVGFMLPGLALSALLIVRLDRAGFVAGTPTNARRAWRLATLILGLPAYITYRLTRPKITLVTCANCGLGRRPDFDKCHRCGSPWSVPELTPPAWRVLGEPESAEEPSSAPSQETGSAAKEV